MPFTFNLKTKPESVQGGSNNPCGICRRQFAKYTCPACNLQYCSLVCYRSEEHSNCTETFYKASLTEQIETEPARTVDEKRQMLELLKRFEEESIENSDDEDEEDMNDLVSRIQGVDLDNLNHNALWGLLSEEERQKFTKMISDPASDDLKRLFQSQELAESHREPWWVIEETSAAALVPTIKTIPRMLLASSQFNPMLLFNILHLSLSYVYAVRTFAVSTLSPIGDQAQAPSEEAEAIRDAILPLSPFLGDRKSTLIFTSVDGVVTDWVSRLSDPPSPAFIQLLIDDTKALFRTRRVVEAETTDSQNWNHESCMRFLSDIFNLVDGMRKYAHVSHKVMFYLAFMAKLPVQALDDLNNAIRTWETRNQTTRDEDAQSAGVVRGPLVQEIS
ncbi:hypothetical protein BDV93DRAFT_521242 [Ceratobasidium sp. AG-I]|nr:hypothetical protein BDV93DRAFT_521242 [Ceratobasidium sp. AG-I]